MTESIDEQRGQVERLRGYFKVQILFAERLAERMPLTISDACLKFTNVVSVERQLVSR